MAVHADSPFAAREAAMSTQHQNGATADGAACAIDTHAPSDNGSGEVDSPVEFSGDVNTNNEIPSQATLRKVQHFMLLDREGRGVQFKDLYSGPNVARRVLVIFIRHFYCGVCSP
jgi:hypothetical protein